MQMQLRHLAGVVVALAAVTSAPTAFAQERDADELARKLSNPVASLVSAPFQANFDFGVKAGAEPRLALLLHHDDAEREFAYDRDFKLSPLTDALDHADDYGIEVVSMKRDWAEVFVSEQPSSSCAPRNSAAQAILAERRRGLH
jgi:hypothetical protein